MRNIGNDNNDTNSINNVFEKVTASGETEKVRRK